MRTPRTAGSQRRGTETRSSIQRAGFAVVATVMALAATGTGEADGTWRELSIAPKQVAVFLGVHGSGLCAFAIAMCLSKSTWTVQEAAK